MSRKIKWDRALFIPKDGRKIENTETGAVAYVHETGEGKARRFYAVMFGGKRQKPDGNYIYRSEGQRDKAVSDHAEVQRMNAEYTAKRKAARAKPTTLKAGDILYSSWGYDQTNVDFYQVTEVKPSGKSIIIRKINADEKPTGGMCGLCTPLKDQFTGEPMLKRVSHTNTVKIASYARAYEWDGYPKHNSWYA